MLDITPKAFGVNLITFIYVLQKLPWFLSPGVLDPMIVMSYINSKKYPLITASLFIPVFAVTLSLTSRATKPGLDGGYRSCLDSICMSEKRTDLKTEETGQAKILY